MVCNKEIAGDVHEIEYNYLIMYCASALCWKGRDDSTNKRNNNTDTTMHL